MELNEAKAVITRTLQTDAALREAISVYLQNEIDELNKGQCLVHPSETHSISRLVGELARTTLFLKFIKTVAKHK